MDVFDLRQQIVQDYANFARSFTRVRADDLKQQIDAIYAKDQFWPEPLLQITPYYERGASLDELAATGEVTATSAAIFRVPDAPAQPLQLHPNEITQQRATQYQLEERIKEQRCLYDIFTLTQDDHTDFDTQLQAVVERLPAGWQFPEQVAARITLQHRHIAGANYQAGHPSQRAPLPIDGVEAGSIEIAYRDEPQTGRHPAFLPQEQTLLETIAARIAGRMNERQVRQTLREREAIFAAMTRRAADSMGLVDFDTGRFVEFNDAAAARLGYSREEFAVLGVANIEADQNLAQVQQSFARIATSGSAVFESRHRHKNGSLRDVRVSVSKIEVGGREYLASTWSDITEEKRIREEIAARQALYHSVVTSMNEGIIVLDGEGKIRACNPAA